LNRIRLATLNDLDILEKLYYDINDYLENSVNYPLWRKNIYPNRETALTGIEGIEGIEGIGKNSLYVFEDENVIKGTVILNSIQEEAYKDANWSIDAADFEVLVIHTLVVSPEFFKKGIAELLVRFAINFAKENNYKTIRLDSCETNKPAISLYEKAGFKFVGSIDLKLPHNTEFLYNAYEMVL